MRRELIRRLDDEPELKQFIRAHPIWYKKLARRPDLWNEMQNEAKDYFGKSLPKRVEKISQGLGMLNMMLELAAMEQTEQKAK